MQRTTWIFGILLMFALALAASGPRPTITHAQEGEQSAEQCAALTVAAPATAASACGDLAPGEVCLGSPNAQAQPGDDAFAEPGATLDLSALDAISTEAADPAAGTWGVVAVAFPANLPEGEAVSGVLFGEATLARVSTAAVERPTLTVSNPTATEANLRGGAGTHYPVVGVLAGGASAVADGRNHASDWIRIQTENGPAWVFARLVTWDGDLSTLDVLAPDDVSGGEDTGAPFSNVTLATGSDSVCAGAGSGLLLQLESESEAEIRVNGATLRFTQATVLLQAEPGAAMDVRALDGEVTVSAQGRSVALSAGEQVSVPLGGEDGLAASAPGQAQAFVLAEASSAPIGLLPGALACQVSATTSNVTLRVGPGETRGALANMRPNEPYRVLGWAADAEGAPWYELDTGAQTSWVRQDAVEPFGACDAVAQVEAPPLVFAAPSEPLISEAGEDALPVSDFSPAANTVWQMYPGTDQMSGECSGAPAINFCDHLAAISPATGGIMWKGMEASPYYLQRIQPNVYAYSGPNVLGTGRISMTLRFTSENAVTMTQTLTLNSEPNCTHTYYYTGEKNW